MTTLSKFRLHGGSRLCWGRHVGGRLCISTSVRSSLPFSPEKAKYHRELEAAVDAVKRACRLCIDVKRSLASGEGRFLEKKKDQTPVTVADFGVQALISLELSRSFPSIPLVAEEDSSVLRSNSAGSPEDDDRNSLVGAVLRAVAAEATNGEDSLSADIVLGAIDRGARSAFSLNEKPATYWVLDPIDGTRGFLKGNDAHYVVGLALVIEGDVVLGIMGCPNWKNNVSKEDEDEDRSMPMNQGIIMISHKGWGTWFCKLSASPNSVSAAHETWKRCYVDPCQHIDQATLCIPDSQRRGSFLLGEGYEDKITLVKVCCGSLCKYLMVASGRVSAFILRARSRTKIKVWDHVAGMACVCEAGGMVTDWVGHPLDLTDDWSERRIISPAGGVLVTNGYLHSQLISLLSPSPSSPV